LLHWVVQKSEAHWFMALKPSTATVQAEHVSVMHVLKSDAP
jgi:hypothetical protein